MRRHKDVVIPGTRSDAPGCRDNGKRFKIREMPADQGERWCAKAKLLLAEAMDTKVPEVSEIGEAAALAKMGVDLTNLRIERALLDPSLDEVWGYITYIHHGQQPRPIQSGENSDIEEIATRTLLRVEALKLNLGFFSDGEPSTSASSAQSTA